MNMEAAEETEGLIKNRRRARACARTDTAGARGCLAADVSAQKVQEGTRVDDIRCLFWLACPNTNQARVSVCVCLSVHELG